MQSRILALTLFIFVSFCGTSQSVFHRTYPNTKKNDNFSISAIQLSDGNYAALEVLMSKDSNDIAYSDTLIVTSYTAPGDVNWTKAIKIDSLYLGLNPYFGSIVQGENDSLYFSFVSTSNEKQNKLIGAASSVGDLGKINSYSTAGTTGDGNILNHNIVNYNKTLFQAYNGGTISDSSLVSLSRLQYNGLPIWSKTYNTTSTKSQLVTDLTFLPDTTIAISGLADDAMFIAVVDTTGKMNWSKKYTSSFPKDKIGNTKVVGLKDSTFVIAVNRQNSKTSDLVKLSKLGNVDWAKSIKYNGLDSCLISDLTVDADQNILVAGVMFAFADSSFNFMVKMSATGDVIWQRKFSRIKTNYNPYGSVFATADGGAAFINSATEFNEIRPSFIKIDGDGNIAINQRSCNYDLIEEIFTPNTYTSDTLMWVSNNVGLKDTVKYEPVSFAYDVPVVTLNVRPFCPNEPINWLFNANTKGAIDYQWSTETNRGLDTLRVFEEGKYSVTVTIWESVCFILCDTAELAIYEMPMTAINISNGNFCVNDKMLLSAGYQPGHPDVKSITWSTGEIAVGSIEIATPGTYSVSVVDGCDETATASINTGPFPVKISAATITGDLVIDCYSGQNTGQLTAKGNSLGLGVERFRWNTGETSAAIGINNASLSTYTVTVIDGCGNTASTSKEARFSTDGVKSVTITIDKSAICTSKSVTLNAVAEKAGNYTYMWSTGSESPRITANAVGTYSVTITDVCGNKASANQEVTEDDITPKDIAYAHVFFPDGINANTSDLDSLTLAAQSLNRTFGPINTPEYCLNEASNYEFYVFNRWGQEVFKSNSISDEWDPKKDDKPFASDTYIWVAKYSIFGISKTVKGDVTLIR